MAIGAESLIVPASAPAEVAIAIERFLVDRGYLRRELSPVRSAASVVSFERRNRRFFFIDQYEDGTCAVAEIGDLADRALAKALSESFPQVHWLALHEAENAWGLESFIRGLLHRSELHPRDAFEGRGGQEYEGDASDDAFRQAESIGDFEPFCGYNQRANGYIPDRVIESIHLAFLRSAG